MAGFGFGEERSLSLPGRVYACQPRVSRMVSHPVKGGRSLRVRPGIPMGRPLLRLLNKNPPKLLTVVLKGLMQEVCTRVDVRGHLSEMSASQKDRSFFCSRIAPGGGSMDESEIPAVIEIH